MSELPENFRDLQEFVPKFAIGDDLLRQASEESAALVLRRHFVDAIFPRLGEINAYLDLHDDEAAHLLGRLAEAACEVALEIGWPSKS